MLRRIRRHLRTARSRYQELAAALPQLGPRPAAALRESLAAGYSAAFLRQDLLAGITVGIVALPLSMALAIAVGVPPQYGLYTAIFGGATAALLAGSRMQVTGPTAAFVVILAPIVTRFGLSGLLFATFLAGLFLLLLGLLRFGRLIQYIPAPVTTGFTMGIATVIAVLQIRDLLGLQIEHMPEHFVARAGALWQALPSFQPVELAMGLGTLAVLILWPKRWARLPSPLVALLLASLAGLLLHRLLPGIELRTIGNCFSYLAAGAEHPGIPRLLPSPQLPWLASGQTLSFEQLRALLPPAFAIAMLGAIESLLSATVADGMASTRHDPDSELLAQGAANMVAPFFGGFAATGALARTATNIRAGAATPLASFFHAVFVLLAMLAFAPLLSYVPMSAFAALLLIVAWNMSDLHAFIHLLRVAPKSDVFVMLCCFGLTVGFDMVIAVSAGVVLAALLFIRRMSEISGASFVSGAHPALKEGLPPGVLIYEIAGPLFFGAASKAMLALNTVTTETRVLIIELSSVPAIDATGLVYLENALESLLASGTLVILCGLQTQPARLLEKAQLQAEGDSLLYAADVSNALEQARSLL